MKQFSKRFLTMLLAAAMVFGLSGMTAFAEEAEEADSSAQDEVTTLAAGDYQEYKPDFDWYTDPEAPSYTIDSPEQLAAFSDIVNDTDLPSGIRQNSFKDQIVNLDCDLEMNKAEDVKSDKGTWGDIATPTATISSDAYAFTPIGNERFNTDGSQASGYSFQGTFNGNGHKIENLYITGDDGYLGLFGVVGGEKGEDGLGLLEDFTVSGVIECEGGSDGSEMDFIGAACAKLNAGATIQYVTTEATIIAPYTDNVGGIVGFAGTPSQMGGSDNITTNPSYGDNPSGYNTFVSCCANEGIVLGYHKVGGIVGENAATVKYCYNAGWILCRRNYQQVRMGGIAGSNGNNGDAVEESVIAYCYNTGPISNNGCDDLNVSSTNSTPGVRAYAGIAGSNYGAAGKNEVYNCYDTGAIPKGYADYNCIASRLDEGGGAYVAVRNNYSLIDDENIIINSASDDPQETGYRVSAENFKKTSYGDDDILTCLGPYFVADENDKYNGGFPILWWQKDKKAEVPSLTKVTVVQGPEKTAYKEGETFDPTGMVVIAEYGDTVRALLTPDGASYEGHWYDLTDGYSYNTDPLTVTDTKITVTYQGIEATEEVDITVGDAKLTGLTVTSPNKTIYSVGDTFDPTGMTITAVFNDGEYTTNLTTDQVTFDPGLDQALTMTDNEITVTYTLGDQTASATVNITVTNEPHTDDEGRYLISNLDELEWFANEVNNQHNENIDALVTADIDASASESFEPIGKSDYPFKGTFDGDGHTITVDVDMRGTQHGSITLRVSGAGVIGNLEGGTVKNLTARGTSVASNFTGGVVGYADGGSIINCTNYVVVTSAGQNAGGILGYSENAVAIENCTNYAAVTGADRTGGVVGYFAAGSTVTDCINKGAVTGTSDIGGIIGYASSNGMITGCGNDGDVTVSDTKTTCVEVGGIAGRSGSDISDSYNKGDILGVYRVGGIVGYMTAKSLDSCYNTGDVAAATTNEDVTYAAGGIIGYCVGSGSAANSYSNLFNTGAVTGEHVGALIGATGSNDIALSNAYYLTGTAEQPYQKDTGTGTVTEDKVSDETEDFIASDDFLNLINGKDAFKKGCTHPVLTWETDEGHIWGDVSWTWSSDYSEATASRSCTVCGIEETAKADVSSEVTREPTISVQGQITYTATATFEDGTEATDTQTVTTSRVGTNKLEDLIDQAEELDEDDYTPSSWEALEAALDAAKAVATNPNSTQSDVDGAISGLQSAMDDLVAKPDKTQLEAAITQAEALDEDDYTATSWKALEEALEAANKVVTDENASQSDVDAALDALQSAMDSLVDAADKDALNAAIEKAEALDEDNYTASSWKSLEEALDAAETVAADKDATQSDVDKALSDLQSAMDGLVDAADKGALNAAIEKAEALEEDDYTATSWKALEEALEAAETVAADKDATQSDVDKALSDLQSAMDGLVDAADKDALNAAIEKAEALDEDAYTADSWKALEEALEAAKTVSADKDATQADVDAALKTLQNAMDDLVDAVDKTGLEAEIAAAEALHESAYTPESWAALQTALEVAKAVDADKKASGEDVKTALADLEAAVKALEPSATPADREALEKAIADAEGLNESGYTKESWTALQTALDAAKTVYADEDATDDAVKEAYDNLEAAIRGLKTAGTTPDKTDLENEIAKVEEEMKDLDKDDYTADSWEALEEALSNAQSVCNDPDATQDAIDEALLELTTAKNNLEKKTDDSGNGGNTKNGLCQITPGKEWGYFVDGKVDTSYTGFQTNSNGRWYVENGYIHFDKNSVYKDINGELGTKGNWYYVVGNKVQDGFTGLAHYRNQYGWWYITDGVVDFTHNGVDKNQNGWWYVKDGKVEFGHNGVDKNRYGWWYITGGKVQFGFTGLANYKNQYGWWYINGGKVNFNANTVAKNKNGWWYVENGKVNFNYTNRVANYKNANGWWYIKNGKVDLTYTGRASNKNGTWNVVNGKVVFS